VTWHATLVDNYWYLRKRVGVYLYLVLCQIFRPSSQTLQPIFIQALRIICKCFSIQLRKALHLDLRQSVTLLWGFFTVKTRNRRNDSWAKKWPGSIFKVFQFFWCVRNIYLVNFLGLVPTKQSDVRAINKVSSLSLELHVDVLNKDCNRRCDLFKVWWLLIDNLLMVNKTQVKLLKFYFIITLTSCNFDFHGMQLLFNKLL